MADELAEALPWDPRTGQAVCPQLRRALGPTGDRKGWGKGGSDEEPRTFVPGNLGAGPLPHQDCQPDCSQRRATAHQLHLSSWVAHSPPPPNPMCPDDGRRGP